MKKEACITTCYSVYVHTQGERSHDFRFDYQPTLADLYSVLKLESHDDEKAKIDAEIIMQLLVLIKPEDFKRAFEGCGGRNYLWVADVKVGYYYITKTNHYNSRVRDWRPPRAEAAVLIAPPPTNPDPSGVDAFGGSDF